MSTSVRLRGSGIYWISDSFLYRGGITNGYPITFIILWAMLDIFVSLVAIGLKRKFICSKEKASVDRYDDKGSHKRYKKLRRISGRVLSVFCCFGWPSALLTATPTVSVHQYSKYKTTGAIWAIRSSD